MARLMVRWVRCIAMLAVALALALPASAAFPHRHKKGFKTPNSPNHHKVPKHHLQKHQMPKHPHNRH